VNAFRTLTADAALAAARAAERAVTSGASLGPLHGVPYSIKDLNFTKGVRTMGGSFIFEHRVPDADAAFIPRLRQAGGIFVGKTTSPEFGWKALGDSPLTSITRNPWNPGMPTGGSSAGAAAAVAAGHGAPADYVGELGRDLKGLRVAYSPDLGGLRVDPEVAALVRAGVRAFEELGCVVEEVKPRFADTHEMIRVMWSAHEAGNRAPFL